MTLAPWAHRPQSGGVTQWASVRFGVVIAMAAVGGCSGGSHAAGRSSATSLPASSTTTSSVVSSTSVPTGSGPSSTGASVVASFDFRDVQAIGASFAVVVGEAVVLRTEDGGLSWSRDYSGDQSLTQVDFVDEQHGWAVGENALLRTVDGVTWTTVGEPSGAVLGEVHFVSPLVGYGLAAPSSGASKTLYQTRDGGLRWVAMQSPVVPLGVSANSAGDLWLAGTDSLWRSRDGGAMWTEVLDRVPDAFASVPYEAVHLQAAGSDNVWAEFDQGQGAGSQRPWILYGGGDNQRFGCVAAYVGLCPSGSTGGSYPGIFTALSPAQVIVVNNCPACTTPQSVVSIALGGQTQPLGTVAVYGPEALSFGTSSTGYLVAGFATNPVEPNSPSVIEITHDGGRTWTRATDI